MDTQRGAQKEESETMMPTKSLEELVTLLQSGRAEGYNFYGVLLYLPIAGLNQRLHEFVVDQWKVLNDLTGPHSLLVAVENLGRGRTIDKFKPYQIYSMARELQVSVDLVPCLVLFTNPKERQNIIALPLRDYLSDGATDDEMMQFFQRLQSIFEACAEDMLDTRMDCLWDGIERAWPEAGDLRGKSSMRRRWSFSDLATGASLLSSLQRIVTSIF